MWLIGVSAELTSQNTLFRQNLNIDANELMTKTISAQKMK